MVKINLPVTCLSDLGDAIILGAEEIERMRDSEKLVEMLTTHVQKSIARMRRRIIK